MDNSDVDIVPRNKLALYVSAFILAVLTSELAAFAIDNVVNLTDTVDITDFAVNNVRSASDTVPLSDSPAPSQPASDTVSLSDSAAPNGQSTSDTVVITDSAANNGQTTTDTVVITDFTGRDTPATDTVVLSDFVFPDSVAMDTVALSDSQLVESWIFHEVFASDTVAIADATAPDRTALDIVALSDSHLVESFIFHELLASDTVAIADAISLFSTVLDIVALADFALLDSTVLDIVSISDSTLVEFFIFHELLASDTVAIVDFAFLDSTVRDILDLSDSALAEAFIFHELLASDIVAISDAVALFSTVFDTVVVTDFTFLDNTVIDIVALSDSTLVESFIFYELLASDIVAIADMASLFSTVLDTVALADLVFLDSTVLDVVALSDSALVESFIFYGITASDVVAIADIASLFSTVLDTVDLSDIAEVDMGVFFDPSPTDIVAIADAVSTFSSVIDIVQISEAVSLPLTSVTDIVDIVITTSTATALNILDQLAIGDSFFDIAATFNRTFNEILAIPDCVFTNESGTCNRVGLASIVLGDLLDLLFSSVNNPTEVLVAQEQLARNFTGGRGPTESMQTVESRSMWVVGAPPPPPPSIAAMPTLPMAMTETMGEIDGLSDPKEAVEVGGMWDMDGFDNEALESILGAMGMPVYNTSMTASSAGTDGMTMVLPTFGVTANVGGELSDDGVFITSTVSDMPAGMQVMIPIDAAGSLGGDNMDALGNITVSFTPADDAGNVTMMIAMLDQNPEDVGQELPEGERAFFIDVSFAGEFTGATPDNSAFFEELPEITFTITEEWAQESEVRSPGGVPVITLFLLDEATGEWTEISDIDAPESAVDGVYTYTATLPHFSTYMVGGDKRLSREAIEPEEFTVDLTESLSVKGILGLGEAQKIPGQTVTKSLTDSMSIKETQPRVQRVLTIHDVAVAVNVVDIKSVGVFGAAATLNFEITNKGDSTEELALRYWYASPAGERLYEDGHTVMIGAGESVVQAVEIPFSSARSYDIMIEASSKDGTLAVTDIAVDVPWLAVNLLLLVIIAVAVVGVSVGYVVYAMRAKLAPSK